MTLISRYVLRELLLVFSVALGALTLFMLVVGLVREAQQQGLGIVQILMLVPYALPEAMRFAVPGTMLFAAASVFGRMSASNEITALRAAGISPLAVIWPAAGLALVVSFVSVWLNDVAVSWGRDGVRRVVVESVEQIIYGRLRQTRSYANHFLALNVKAVDGRRLIRPTLSLTSGPGGAAGTRWGVETKMPGEPPDSPIVFPPPSSPLPPLVSRPAGAARERQRRPDEPPAVHR
ncbi:MAG: LptF/LptG family permease, partial [Planctomycetaceae bacterium]